MHLWLINEERIHVITATDWSKHESCSLNDAVRVSGCRVCSISIEKHLPINSPAGYYQRRINGYYHLLLRMKKPSSSFFFWLIYRDAFSLSLSLAVLWQIIWSLSRRAVPQCRFSALIVKKRIISVDTIAFFHLQRSIEKKFLLFALLALAEKIDMISYSLSAQVTERRFRRDI